MPSLIVQARQTELRREFIYALASLMIGGVLSTLVFGGFIFLVLKSHPEAATGLLGVGVLNLVTTFVRARLASR